MTKTEKIAGIVLTVDDVTIAYLHECFILDVETGLLFWKRRPDHHFPDPVTAMRINACWEGRKAGSFDHRRNRLKVQLGGYSFRYHRVVFAMANGIDLKDVPAIIDHINGDSSDNRPCNLRGATPQQSVWNTKLSVKSTTGAKGVHLSHPRGRFVAVIKAFGRRVQIGTFDTKEEAAAAYKGAAKIVQGEYMRDT